ncbi:MAG: NifB/NifX family molybdenum-iron cluster-binding protein [Planctomycetota bacterium]
MKIAVSADKQSDDATVDPRFGRAACFAIVETDTGETTFIDNAQNLQAAQGAGIQAAQTVAESGAQWVLTGHCGPKAFRALSAAGIKVATDVSGPVAAAVEQFKAGAFDASTGADVEGHW